MSKTKTVYTNIDLERNLLARKHEPRLLKRGQLSNLEILPARAEQVDKSKIILFDRYVKKQK